ncbi:MAG: exodeoxyribonuclease III [Candidatus Eisenbacteria bacterium]
MAWTIASWNVNSLKVRLPQLLEWLAHHRPDAVALQETKSDDPKFPAADLVAAGYQVVFSGQKTYNGVAILARASILDPAAGLPGFPDEQKRVLAATVDGVRVIDLYVPNGQSVGSDKYKYKLEWLGALHAWLAEEMRRHEQLVVLGDFNIAPADEDVHDPAEWEGQVLFSDPERAAFHGLVGLGFVDTFRRFEQEPRSFSWWDYRMNAFTRNRGLRIDHILASPALAARLKAAAIDVEPRRAERPSDHAPVLATFD